MTAATQVVAAQGVSAPTADIAKAAGVSHGSLFTYFATKSELLIQLFLELKGDMARAALAGLPSSADLRARAFHGWRNWMQWAVANPEKRRALAHLGISEEVVSVARMATHKPAGELAELMALMEECRSIGPMREAPPVFAAAIINAMAEATMDFMVLNPAGADKHCEMGFETFWRAFGH